MKNLLIEDYIKLMCLNKKYFANTSESNLSCNYLNIKQLCEKSLNIYESLINKFNKNDLSLFLVKNEIYSAPNFNIEINTPTLNYVYNEIIKLLSTLKKFSKSSKIKASIISLI